MQPDCDQISEVSFLLPGQLFFTSKPRKIQTVLGSCVTITMYSHEPRFGVICHAVHPDGEGATDVKYVDSAIERMLLEVKKKGIPLSNIEVKLFGGGFTRVSEDQEYTTTMGYKNVLAAKKKLFECGQNIMAECVGEACGRKLIFCSKDGKVYVKKIGALQNGDK